MNGASATERRNRAATAWVAPPDASPALGEYFDGPWDVADSWLVTGD